MKNLILIFTCFLFLSSCQSVKLTFQDGHSKNIKSLSQYLKESEEVNSYFFGLQLYDLEKKAVVFDHQADRYYTPASNTKLLTLYSSMHSLQDSIAFMEVYQEGNEIIYQPMADPSFLHPALETDQRIKNYFKNQKQDTIILNLGQFQDLKFGSGWAWNDYPDYYQTEKSAFPIASNLIAVQGKKVTPAFMADQVSFDQKNPFVRGWANNEFSVEESEKVSYYPVHVDEEFLTKYFKEQGKSVEFYYQKMKSKPIKTIYSKNLDSVYYALMQESDNHIAEQLLLQASQIELGYMNTNDYIDFAKKEIINFTPDELNWNDGSGLGRYNLFTPRSLVRVVNQLVDEKGIEWITQIFPVGGQSGTIKNNYKYTPPRVFAKTGTLRNNHCLSGIVQAKSGKWYSFSMMNNNFPGSSSYAKAEMENILKLIIELY